VGVDQLKTAVPEALQAVLHKLSRGQEIPATDIDNALDLLQSYECWQPFFRILRQKIDHSQKREINHYVRLAHIQGMYLEDWFAAAETCFRLVRDFKLSYSDFRKLGLGEILTEEDFSAEATILQGIYDALPRTDDKVHCLERLCLIYEKKKFDEYLLNQSYLKLLDLDPRNMKALKYFKVLHLQNYEWDEVVKVLQTMHESSSHQNDRFRIAQELATVYLYQMNSPQQAIEVIESLCQDSPLDTSTVHYEAFYRLEDWSGCLKVLRESLLKVETDKQRAIIYLKVGELEERLGHFEKAEESYVKSAQLQTVFLEPLEHLIRLSLDNREWQKTQQYLADLEHRVKDPELQIRVREALDRVKQGLSSQARPSGDTPSPSTH